MKKLSRISWVKYFFYVLIAYSRLQFIESQYRKMETTGDVTWGYMNMLPHEGYFLNITALKTTQQPSNDKCIVDCVETTDCFSINAVQQPNNTVQCQLLSGNKHRNSTEYVAFTGSTHFYIPSDCDYEEICINPRKKCIPNYATKKHECECLPHFDVNCLFKNLASNQTVTASTYYGNDESTAVFVVDGLYGPKVCDSAFPEAKIFMSLPRRAYNQWLRIYFGGWKHAQFVEVHNRRTSVTYMRRMSNTQFYVYGKSPTDNRQFCTEIVDGKDPIYYLPCVKTLYGKGIEMFYPYPGDRSITVCEMIVLGY